MRSPCKTLLLLAALAYTCVASSQDKFENSPKGLCAYLTKVGKRQVRGNSLVYVRTALNSIGAIPDQSISNSQGDSAGELKKLGFANLQEMDENILLENGKIPDGALVVMKKKPGCQVPAGVNIPEGFSYVMVKCGSQFLIHPNQPLREADGVLASNGNKKCVTGVMYNPKWDQAPNSNSRTVTSDASPETTH